MDMGAGMGSPARRSIGNYKVPTKRLLVIGRSESGKSTFINMVANLYIGRGYRDERILAIPMRIEGKDKKILPCNVERFKERYRGGQSVCSIDGKTYRWSEYKFETPYYVLTLIDTPAMLPPSELSNIGPITGIIYVHRVDDNRLVEEYEHIISGQTAVYTVVTHTVQYKPPVVELFELSSIPNNKCFSFDNECMVPRDLSIQAHGLREGEDAVQHRKRQAILWEENTHKVQELIEDIFNLAKGFVDDSLEEVKEYDINQERGLQEAERREADRRETESREKAKLEAKRIEAERKKAEVKMQEERYREEQRLHEVRRREQERREETERQDRLAREEALAKHEASKKKNQDQGIYPTNGNQEERYREEQRLQEVRRREQERREEAERQDRLAREEARAKHSAAKNNNNGQGNLPTEDNKAPPSPLPINTSNFGQTILNTPKSVISEIVVTLADETILSQYHLSILYKSRINLENMGRVMDGVKRDNTVRDGMDRRDMDIVKIEVPDEIKNYPISQSFPKHTKSPSSHPNIICMACKTTCIATPLMKKEDLTDPNFLTKHNTFDKYLDCTKCQHDVSMHIYTLNEYTASIKEIEEREYKVESRAHTYVIRENKNANKKIEDIDAVINNMQKWEEWADDWIDKINADIVRNTEQIQRCSDRISNNLSMIVYLCIFIPSITYSNGNKYDYFEYYIRKCKIEGEKEYPCRKQLIEAYIQKKNALHNLPSSKINSSMLIQANKDYLLDTIIRIQQDLQAQLLKLQPSS